MRKLILLLCGLSVACTSGGGGSGNPQVYSPTISEPEVEVLGELEQPQSTWSLMSKCSKDMGVDPRLKVGQVFKELREGKYSNGNIYTESHNIIIQSANEGELSYTDTLQSGEHYMNWSVKQTCVKKDKSVECSGPDFQVINTNVNIEKLQSDSNKSDDYNSCSNKWRSLPSDQSEPSVFKSELVKVKVGTGEKVLALRVTQERDEKNECPDSAVVRLKEVRIGTLQVPSHYASSAHCTNEIYSLRGFYDKTTGQVIKEDRSLISTLPTQTQLGNYPGFDDGLASMYRLKKVEEKRPEEGKALEQPVQPIKKNSNPSKKVEGNTEGLPTELPAKKDI